MAVQEKNKQNSGLIKFTAQKLNIQNDSRP